MNEVHICEYCGKEHDGTHGSGRFCCQSCSRRYSSNLNKESRIEKITESVRNYYKKVSSRKVLITKVCEHCGSEFSTYKHHQRFCSRHCHAVHNFTGNNYANKLSSEEWSIINKRSYALGHNYVAGGTAKWYRYKDLKVQGSYEVRVCRVLDEKLSRGLILSWEYTKDRIPYTWSDGSAHTYLLDFKVTELDGSVYYIESKGYVRDHDEEKWDAARDLGIDLRVWFLDDISAAESSLELSESIELVSI